MKMHLVICLYTWQEDKTNKTCVIKNTKKINQLLKLYLISHCQVHRRLLWDDYLGVGEPLNETGMDGKGLIARGKIKSLSTNLNAYNFYCICQISTNNYLPKL